MLYLEKIEKSFGEKRVLCGASLHLARGETAALCGASGCGKTTLLRIAAGLETPDAGTASANGKLAFVFAEPRLFAGCTALENVMCVMRGNRREAATRAGEILDALELSAAKSLRPSELSGGMASRVALARAVAFDAEIYLMDEPFARLDGESKARVLDYMRAFLRNKTALWITHDAAEAEAADRIFRMRDGRVFEENF